MYPQQMGFSPDEDDITLNPIVDYTPKAGIQISGGLGIDGSVTMTIYPSMGFQIQLGALGVQLVDSKVSSSFTLGVTLHVGANSDGDCDGAIMALDLNAGATIDLTNPLPSWDFVEDVNWDVMPLHSIRMKDQTCYPWSGSVGTGKWKLQSPISHLNSHGHHLQTSVQLILTQSWNQAPYWSHAHRWSPGLCWMSCFLII